MGPPTSERTPGYKKGTKSMAGECGMPGPSERIVGGTEATPHSYPWMAALFVDGKWFCGGTLISDEWVLTAAHCAKDASEMRIMLGAHEIKEESEEGRIEVITRDFFTHENYNTINLHNDLALVHLPEPVTFTGKTTICSASLHFNFQTRSDLSVFQLGLIGKLSGLKSLSKPVDGENQLTKPQVSALFSGRSPLM